MHTAYPRSQVRPQDVHNPAELTMTSAARRPVDHDVNFMINANGEGQEGGRGKGTIAGEMPAVTRHWVARVAQSISASRAILRSSSVVPPSACRQATAAPASSATASL